MSHDLFILGDADDVRKKLQGFLLSGNLEALRLLSSALTRYIAELAALAKTDLEADVIFCGGDELLARVSPDAFEEAKLRELIRYFSEHTGVTISFGVGRSTEEAFVNLARAKAMGPGSLFPTYQVPANPFERTAEATGQRQKRSTAEELDD